LIIKILQLGGFFIFSVIISLLCNSLLLKFSKSLGIRNNNDVIVRWSNQSKPSLGGVSFYIVLIFSSIGYSIIFSDEYIFHNIQYVGLISAGSLAFVMGLADDAYNTRPIGKLLIQIFCGCLLVITNTYIQISGVFIIDATITVLWVITIMNSLNMLDNMDGITGTTVVFILLSCILASFIIFELNRNIWSIILIAQIGAIIGFLYYNVNPSKLFMGDAGSQYIGLLVAFFSIKFLWNIGEITGQANWIGVIICLIAFTPAAVDSLTVTINRIKKGKSPMVGGKDHTTHHLVYAGLTDKQVWYVFLLIALFSTIFSVFLVYLCMINITLPIPFFLLYFIAIFFVLYRFTIKYKSTDNEK
jgi:UDP-GlcNAc:undecaprenyl-phosphate/decaprenyl-phosphate GlcNAc-1-phosphate transferase